MHNVAMNYLKNNYMIKKGCKSVVSMFDSRQSFFIQDYLKFLVDKNKDNKDRNIYIIDFTARKLNGSVISGAPNTHYCRMNLSHLGHGFAELVNKCLADKTKKNVVIVLGFEIYINLLSESKVAEVFEAIHSESLDQSVRSLHLLMLPDQLLVSMNLKKLQRILDFTLDFRGVDHFDKFSLFAVNYQESSINVKEKISGVFKDGGLMLSKFVTENTVIEQKDPDKLIKSTFKLGISDKEKTNKDKLVLPYYQEKQVKEMEEKVLRGDEQDDDDDDEQVELGVDDEVDEDEDLDV